MRIRKKIKFPLMYTILLLKIISSVVISNELEIKDDLVLVENGRFSLRYPKGWCLMNISKMDEIKRAGFIGGFREKDSSSKTPSYFLMTLTNHQITSKKKQTIIKHTNKLTKYSKIQAFLEDEGSQDKIEFYNVENNIFIFLVKYRNENWPNKSIMLKKFDEHGAMLVHFYCSNNIKKDIDIIEDLVKSFKVKQKD